MGRGAMTEEQAGGEKEEPLGLGSPVDIHLDGAGAHAQLVVDGVDLIRVQIGGPRGVGARVEAVMRANDVAV